MKYLLVFLVFLPYLINAGVMFGESDALEEEAGILRQKHDCVYMKIGNVYGRNCGEQDSEDLYEDLYNSMRTKRSTIRADVIRGDVHQRCNGDFSQCVVIDGGRKKRSTIRADVIRGDVHQRCNGDFSQCMVIEGVRHKRGWHCVGNCGSIQHIGNTLVRSGGDNSCVCMET